MAIKFSEDGPNGEWLVRVGPAKLSYPHLVAPYKSREPGKVGKFGAKLLLKRDDVEQKADAVALNAKIKQMCQEKFKQSIPTDKLCLRDGKSLTDDLHPYFVVSASESIKPVLVDRKRQVVNEEDVGDLFYPGANVVAVIRLWAQDSRDFGRRINANLVSLQAHSHGERLGGRARPNVNEIYDDISGQFDESEYEGGPTGEGGSSSSDPGDDGFGDEDGL
jgi:hypothetical protein